MTQNLDQLLKYCNFLINKSQVADSISPDEFNVVLPVVNQEVFNDQIKKVLQTFGQPGLVDAYKNSYLSDCEDIYSETDTNDSFFALPTGFNMFTSLKVKIGNRWMPVRQISSMDAYNNSDGMNGANDEDITAWIVGRNIYLNSVVNEVKMIYIKSPDNPHYDYCMNGYDILYLPEGVSVVYNEQTWDVTINGVTYQSVTPGYGYWTGSSYTSQSKEFAWNDKLIPQITNLIFEKMGINIREQAPIEVAQIKKNEK